jgi:hypothetical protein
MRRDDKFLRGSTTSLVNTSRDIPIVLAGTPDQESILSIINFQFSQKVF